MDLNEIFSVSEKLVKSIGKRMQASFASTKKLDIEFKTSPRDLVTEIDRWAENQIINTVRKHFPTHLVIGEETYLNLEKEKKCSIQELTKEGIVWVVDPLDGTNNFANSIPHVAISIGILKNGKRKMSIIYDPNREELFTATKGQGAKLNNKPIKVGTKNKLIQSMVSSSYPSDRAKKWKLYKQVIELLAKNSRSLRITGSAALDQAWVACSRLDCFFEYTLKPWDVAGGSLLVEEAGGLALNLPKQKEFDIFSNSFLFANKNICKEVLNLIG